MLALAGAGIVLAGRHQRIPTHDAPRGPACVVVAQAALRPDSRGDVRIILMVPTLHRVWRPDAAALGLGLTATTLPAVADAASAAPAQAVAPQPAVVETRLRAYLRRIQRASYHRAHNATLLPLANGGFRRLPEASGWELNTDAAVRSIEAAWNGYESRQAAGTPTGSGIQSGPSGPQRQTVIHQQIELTLPLTPLKPTVAAANLASVDGELSSFSTRFGGSGRSRGSNIVLAAERINGTCLAPGEVFSYNDIVGPRDESAGFRTAPVIVHGELVPGMGGGVCQVSSTLYNAVLLADLKVMRRSHHAFPVHYLPAGRDATVAYGAIDFRFQNSTPAPIIVAASAARGRLTFRIFGEKTPGREVAIALLNQGRQPAGVEIVRDPQVAAGRRIVKDKGHIGRRVTVYRIVRQNGAVVAKEIISRDHYRPFPRVVIVGTRGAVRSKPANKAASAPAGAPRAPAPPTNGSGATHAAPAAAAAGAHS